MEKLNGKVALVTGGSRGIGRAIAQRLAEDGAAIALTYHHHAEAAEQVAAGIRAAGGSAVALHAELDRAEDLTPLFDAAERELGRIDIVVANAGTFLFKPIAEVRASDFEQAFAVNARGSLLTLAEAARRLPSGGRIIGVSTLLTIQPREGLGLYAASKAAVEQFVKALAREIGPRGITVNAVSPGPTDTDMVAPARRESAPKETPLRRLGQPRDIADVVAFLASEEARWITGQIIGTNGGLA